MRLAIADPPYLGLCKVYDHDHRSGGCWDDLETWRGLATDLEGFDGWAVHSQSTALADLLPIFPRSARGGAWIKPFASWKPGVSPTYAWEPVIFVSARKLPEKIKVADYVSVSITLKRGFVGAKPEQVVWWILAMLGASRDDEIVDLFPGSGAVSRAIERWRDQLPLLEDAS